jgi:hypothetical protein
MLKNWSKKKLEKIDNIFVELSSKLKNSIKPANSSKHHTIYVSCQDSKMANEKEKRKERKMSIMNV